MAKVLLVLAAIGVTIYAAIDCLRSDDAEIRGLPKPLWLLVILALPLFGGVMWILVGHEPMPGTPTGRRYRTIAPDDDPDFLRSLDPPRSRDGDRRRKDGPADGDEDGDPKPAK
jgi:Phospholipase_D-nuclease N-terminal